MRLLALALLVAPATSVADSFVEVAGGVMIPASNDQWTDYVDSGPKLAARVGSVGQTVGGMVSIDWSPINTDDTGFGNAFDVSAHRFRILIAAVTHQRVGANLTASFRVGAGADIAYTRIETNILGFRNEASDTDVGLALEAGFGLWFNVGSMQVGGELALPIGFHDDGPDNDIDLEDYTSVDLDLLFGVRFLSK
jgi:hypothetical protein